MPDKPKSNKPAERSSATSSAQSVRINKFLADAGLCSRREADTWVSEGRVSINDVVVTQAGAKVNTTTDVVVVDGKTIGAKSKKHTKYVLFHKPTDCITTRKDEKDRKTIYHYLPKEYSNLKPAGRLDRATTGLLILSDDGDFLHKITHPSFEHHKEYVVTLDKKLKDHDAQKLVQGIRLYPENKLAKMVWIEQIEIKEPVYSIGLITGLNRQVRRSFEELDYRATKLKRVAFGDVVLGRLKIAEYRDLTPLEVKMLTKSTLKPADKTQ